MESGLSKQEELAATGKVHPLPRHASQCPAEDWLSFLGHRWTALVLWHLSSGPKRFSDIMEGLPGITPKVATERLATFAQRALVTRSSTATFPRRTVYMLTPKGHELSSMVQQLYDWSSGFDGLARANPSD